MRAREINRPGYFTSGVLAIVLGVAGVSSINAAVTRGQPLWTVDGVAISTAERGQGIGSAAKPGSAIVADGNGGMFLIWEDIGSASVVAQRLDANGIQVWNGGGVDVAIADGFQMSPVAVSDGAGGVIVAWVDGRNGFCNPGFLGECNIYAQRLDVNGQRIWQTAGMPVVTAERNQGSSGIAITPDGAGGAILAWEDARPPNCCRVFAQRIGPNGQPIWAADGIAVSRAPTFVIGPMSGSPRIASDTSGGAIIAWLDNQMINAPPLVAQRVTAAGDALWGDGVSVGFPIRTPFAMAEDGGGGALFAWQVQGQTGDDLVAQRLNGSGQVLWGANGAAVAVAPFMQDFPDVVSDGADGAIVVWQDARNDAEWPSCGLVGNCDIYAQRLNANGQPVWEPNGISVSSAANAQFAPRVVPDGFSGAIVVWMDCRDRTDNFACGFGLDLRAQRVTASAELLWASDGIPVSTAPGNQGIPPGTPAFHSISLASDGLGGAFVAWPDGRIALCQQLNSDCDLFVQRVGDHRLQPVPLISVNPPFLDFGLTTIGSPVDTTFIIQNLGDDVLSGSANAITPFTIVSGSPFNLSAGAMQSVTVRFSPTGEGTVGADTMFTSNGGSIVRAVGGQGTLQPTVALTVGRSGTGSGIVTDSTVAPIGINCGFDCSHRYLYQPPGGIVVNLFPSASAGSSFTGWSGGGCSGTGPCHLIMSSDIAVTAAFELLPFSVTVVRAGSGDGTITGPRINCGADCSDTFAGATVAALTALPYAGSIFARWSGCDTVIANSCTVTTNSNRLVAATFSRSFTDDPLVPQVHFIKAQHLTELQQAIDALRSRAGLPVAGFTPVMPGVMILGSHISELRSALDSVYDAHGRARPSYTDPVILGGQTGIKALHLTEIRNAIRTVE